MIRFIPIQFDPRRCAEDLVAYRQLLDTSPLLPERRTILPFFRQHQHLTALLGGYHRGIESADRLAYEFRLFGAFTPDVVIGDWERKAFCFIEFEDGNPDSIFTSGRRGTNLWSPRFERGFSQICDWYWQLDDLRGTAAFTERFGASTIDVAALLVIGRDSGLTDTDRARLEWRRRHVLVDSQHIYCCTYDKLLRDLQRRLTIRTLVRRV